MVMLQAACPGEGGEGERHASDQKSEGVLRRRHLSRPWGGGLWFGRAYPMGTAGRMGVGYFPKVLAAILIGFGVIAMLRGLRIEGPALDTISLKQLLLIFAAFSLFGVVLEPLGLMGALFILIVMTAMASSQSDL
jgi:hypothetical protein